MTNLSRPASLFVLLTTALCCAYGAYAYTPPEVKQQGDITYITGGIGEGEADALKAEENKYNLHITSADTHGAYSGDTQLTITDKSGKVLLSIDAGPILNANLPAGKYTIVASTEGQTKKRTVVIGTGKPAHVHFGWNLDLQDDSTVNQ